MSRRERSRARNMYLLFWSIFFLFKQAHVLNIILVDIKGGFYY